MHAIRCKLGIRSLVIRSPAFSTPNIHTSTYNASATKLPNLGYS